jgi:hypothetical protein
VERLQVINVIYFFSLYTGNAGLQQLAKTSCKPAGAKAKQSCTGIETPGRSE